MTSSYKGNISGDGTTTFAVRCRRRIITFSYHEYQRDVLSLRARTSQIEIKTTIIIVGRVYNAETMMRVYYGRGGGGGLDAVTGENSPSEGARERERQT